MVDRVRLDRLRAQCKWKMSCYGRITAECDGQARRITIGVSSEYRGKRALEVDGKPATFFSEDADRYTFEVPAGPHRIELR
jgi:hypothetical protein